MVDDLDDVGEIMTRPIDPSDPGSEAQADTQAERVARGQWTSRIGFILAALGSAVGLGNIWRFPFMTAANGGGAFVVLYLTLLVLVGVPGLYAELAIGRKTSLNAVGSFREAGRYGQYWKYAGILGVLAAMTVLSFYAVVAGWTIQYFLASFTGSYMGDPQAFLTGTIEGPRALLTHFVTMTIVAAVIAVGIANGIERAVTLMVPSLIVIGIGIAIYGFFLPGSGAGYAFYLQPNWSRLTNWASFKDIAVDAAGQTAFTLSLGQGALITYGSYLEKDTDLSEDGLWIAGGNTGVGLLGGFMVFPILGAFGLLGAGGGVATTFVALPAAFAELGLIGQALGALFFLALFFAAFTSAISLLEVPVSYVVDEWGVDRWRAAILLAEIIAGVGILAALDQDMLAFLDELAVNVMILTGLLLLTIYAGWFVPNLKEEVNRGSETLKVGGYVQFMLRYVTPVILAVLVIQNTPEFFMEAYHRFT